MKLGNPSKQMKLRSDREADPLRQLLDTAPLDGSDRACLRQNRERIYMSAASILWHCGASFHLWHMMHEAATSVVPYASSISISVRLARNGFFGRRDCARSKRC